MISEADESIAWAMETDVRLLPVLADLLADLSVLGPSPEEVISILRSVGVEPGSRVLDLGSGKGAIAVALAESLGLAVQGIDAFPPFVRSARELAKDRGVDSRCLFKEGDIRELLGKKETYDVVLLVSIGPIAGDYEETMRGIRTLVRKGGFIIIEDGFLADGVPQSPETEEYSRLPELLRGLTASGDGLVLQIESSAEETRSVNEKNTELIRLRAEIVKKDHPELSGLIDEYVARQERETRVLGTDVTCAIWVLERV